MIKTSIGDTRAAEIQDLLSLILSLEQGFMWDDKYATGRLDTMAGDPNTLSVLSKIYGLLAIQVRMCTAPMLSNHCLSCQCALPYLFVESVSADFALTVTAVLLSSVYR